jgi:hypothetical protein
MSQPQSASTGRFLVCSTKEITMATGKRWYALGQDYWHEGAAIAQKQVREAVGDVCRIRQLADGRWQLQVFE